MSIFTDNYGDLRAWVAAPLVVVAALVAFGILIAAIAYGLILPVDRYGCHRYEAQTHQQVKYDNAGITCYVKTDRGWIDRDSLYVNKND